MTDATDCNDGDADAHPGSPETAYDAVDNDCDPGTSDDDLDGDGEPYPDDCNDNDAKVSSTAGEVSYDAVDNDCDPATPDDDLDGDGFDLSTDCDDTEPADHPGAADGCDDRDNDCNGEPDPWCTALFADGSQIQTIDLRTGEAHDLVQLEYWLDPRTFGDAADLCVTSDGRLAVLDVSFNEALSIWDPATEAWVHWTAVGLTGIPNAYFGGIACGDGVVYAVGPEVIARFSLADGAATSFGSGTDLMDLAVGADGLIYVAPYNGPIQVYDPLDLSLVGQITLPDYSVRGLAVTADSILYGPDVASEIVQTDLDGEEMKRWTSPAPDTAQDIDLAGDGGVLVTTTGGALVLIDATLTTSTTVETGIYWGFAGFAHGLDLP